MSRFFTISLLLLILWWWCNPFATISHPPGVLLPMDPDQVMLPATEPSIDHEGWKLQPLAMYLIKARVLSTTRYRFDPTSSLAPYDVAVGWGCMSDSALIDSMMISQTGRWYSWSYEGAAMPVTESEVAKHSANMHLIPNDSSVLAAISNLRAGSLIYLTGCLVEATSAESRPWRSSLTRTDTGNGACEIMLVRSLRVLN